MVSCAQPWSKVSSGPHVIDVIVALLKNLLCERPVCLAIVQYCIAVFQLDDLAPWSTRNRQYDLVARTFLPFLDIPRMFL